MRFIRTNRRGAVLLILWMCCAGVAFAHEDTLAQAKDLYATAAYDEALAVLDRLQSQAAGNESTAIAEYRLFCLVALDRRDEARRTIEAILTENPQYLPSEDLASPRIQTVFRDTRRQLLPTIVRDRYAAAKAAFERKDPRAGDHFAAVLTLLDDPDVRGVPALADLRTVVSAFRDLTTAMAVPAIVRAADSAPQFPMAPARMMGSNTIYTVENADVIPAMPITQRVPRWAPPKAYGQQDFRGTLEVLVDEQGAVTSASLRARVHPAYDADLLKAVRTWKFAPATKQGVPVRYLKTIDIRLTPPLD